MFVEFNINSRMNSKIVLMFAILAFMACCTLVSGHWGGGRGRMRSWNTMGNSGWGGKYPRDSRDLIKLYFQNV